MASQNWMNELWKELTTPPSFMNRGSDRPVAPKPPQQTQAKTKDWKEDLEETEEPEPSVKDINLILRANGFPPRVGNQYPFVVQGAVPYGSVMRLDTSVGPVALKRSHASPQRLQFMGRALQHLEKKGFLRHARIVPNVEGDLFTPYRDHFFYVTRWVKGQSTDLSSMVHVSDAASAIAEMHHLSRGFQTSGYKPHGAFDLEKVLKSRVKELDSFLVKAQGKRRPDAVDRFVVKQLPTYKRQAQQALKLLADPKCREFLQADSANPGLCHLDITPQNLIYAARGGIHLIDFEMISYGPRMLDIGHFVRRTLQANNWSREPAILTLVQVNRVEPLRFAEYRILQTLLTFPHSAWRSIRNHYRNPTPYTLARLEQLQEQETDRQAFLDDFAAQVERYKGK
ncbi:CotS family spore coat protein [Effusibacillus lacus]|nr:CotS family spore coat protein [Effusibacillus lacus]TCS73556.1 CotS family spore coat protein [Effusibacillus lacus]